MAGRSTMTVAVTIARTPEQVFGYVSDVAKTGEWSPKPWRMEGLSGPVAKGTTFTSIGTIPGDKNHRNEVEITEYDPPSRFALRAAEKGEHFNHTFEISAEGSGTKLTRTMDGPVPGGFLRLLWPILVPIIRNDAQKGLNKLKANLEQAS